MPTYPISLYRVTPCAPAFGCNLSNGRNGRGGQGAPPENSVSFAARLEEAKRGARHPPESRVDTFHKTNGGR